MNSLLEEFVNLLLREKIRSSTGFDLNAFKKLPSAKEALQYAIPRLTQLGQGTSRAVFTLTSKRVLKIALNKAGIAQNNVEIEVAAGKSPIIARIFEHSPEGHWLISELVRPFDDYDTEEIEKMLNLGADNVMFETFASSAVRGQFAMLEKYGAGHQLDLARAIHEVASEFGLKSGDVAKGGSWGLTADRCLVLIDYGFNDESASHYSYGTPID